MYRYKSENFQTGEGVRVDCFKQMMLQNNKNIIVPYTTEEGAKLIAYIKSLVDDNKVKQDYFNKMAKEINSHTLDDDNYKAFRDIINAKKV